MSLFDLPEGRPKLAVPPAAPRFTAYVPRGRVHCDDCVRAIHEQGWDVAPPMQPVRWRQTTPDLVRFLCHHHKDLRSKR